MDCLTPIVRSYKAERGKEDYNKIIANLSTDGRSFHLATCSQLWILLTHYRAILQQVFRRGGRSLFVFQFCP
jgi:hypothetical protein